MNILELQKQIHQTAKDKGWWEGEQNLNEKKGLINSELSEAIEADREGKHPDWEKFNSFKDEALSEEDAFRMKFELHVKDTVGDELADAVIRALDLRGYIGFNFEELPPTVIKFTDNFCENILFLQGICTSEFNNAFVRNYNILVNIGIDASRVISEVTAFSKRINIDLEKHIELKMKYNKTRKYKHDGKRY